MANYLIIAGTSDIGQATAKMLQHHGHQVFITGRNAVATKALAQQLALPYAILDATDFTAVDAVFAAAADNIGTLNGVVNCAGSLWLKSIMQTQADDYQQVIAANLTTAFATVRAAAKHMATSGGTVTLIATAAALAGFANHEAIAAAKAGVIGLAMSAAASYAAHNLRFNVVAPGLVATKLTTNLTQSPMTRKVSEAMHPLGRLGKISDVVNAITFLLDPANDWITGQTLTVDGGLSQLHQRVKV